MDCTECIKDIGKLFDAWNVLVALTNDPNVDESEIEVAYRDYDQKVEDLAVKNGHPPGKPRRRP